MAYILLLIVIAAIGGMLFSVHRLGVQQQIQLLCELARNRNGLIQKNRLTYPKLCFPYKTYQVTLFSTILIGGENPPYTRVRVPLNISRDIILSLYQGHSNPYNKKILKSFHIEHSKFENAFNIEGQDEYFLWAFLSPQIQEQLLKCFVTFGGECSIIITNQRFEACIHQIPNTTMRYEQFLEIALVCLERVRLCTTIQSVLFGHSISEITTSEQILENPHLSDSTVPMLTLQHIIIDSETYVSHQVEQFLTYAVNHIGQTYLKHYVDVHIYGDMQRLHSNLRNALTNLCRSIVVHDEHRCLTPTSV